MKGRYTMKKKMTAVLALCIALCAAAGCSGGAKETQTTTAPGTSASVTENTAGADTGTTPETSVSADTTEKDAPAAEGTVIYDANDIKITATDFGTSPEYFDEKILSLDIVNNTGKVLNIYKKPCSMGGWMIEPDLMTVSSDGKFVLDGTFTVPAGNDTNKYCICIVRSVLESYGLTEIPDLELGFEIYVGDEPQEGIFTDTVDIVNPAASGISVEHDDSGITAYDKDGIKIVYKGAEYDTDYWGPTVRMYAYNGTDKTIHICVPKSTLNGKEYEAYGDMIISPGRHFSGETLFGEASKEAPLGTVEMTFDIYEYGTGDEEVLLDTSGPCKAEFEPAEIPGAENALTPEEISALKGWWTREGNFKDDSNNFITITFQTTADNWDKNAWYTNGNFNGKVYWGGETELTDEGLKGTVPTVSFDGSGNYSSGDPIEVKITEDGTDGILLTLGTGEEYHLVPVTE